jgi:hypothetical protein
MKNEVNKQGKDRHTGKGDQEPKTVEREERETSTYTLRLTQTLLYGHSSVATC